MSCDHRIPAGACRPTSQARVGAQGAQLGLSPCFSFAGAP